MKFIFWLALTIETAALGWFLYQTWVFTQKDAAGEYHDPYRKVLYPAAVLGVIVLGGLLARYVFHAPKIATYIALTPAIALALSLIGMMVASVLAGGKWH